MKKLSFVSICLAIVMIFSLTACSASPATATTTTAATSTTTTATTAATSSSTNATTAVSSEIPAGGHVAAEANSEKPLRIAFLGWANNPFHDEIKKGVTAAGDYLKQYNATVEYVVMGEDITLDFAVSALENAIAKKYDGIICIPAFDGTEVYINKAFDAGIPVINCVAEGSKPSKRLLFYGQNGEAAGQLAGKLIQEYMGGSGKVGVITGILGATQHELRKNGAIDYLKANAPDIKVVGVYENNDKAETAYSLTKDMLTANPDLKCVYVTAGGPFGAAKAIQDAGLTGKVGVVGFDWLPDSLKYVKSGEIVDLISQDPFGQGFDTCVMMHNYLTKGTKPGKDIVDVAPVVVSPDTLSELLPEYK